MSDDLTGQYQTRPPVPVAPEGPRTPAASAVPDLRGGLRRLSGGLIAYGLIGLIVAAIALGALLWVNQRLGTLRSEIDTTIARLAATTENTTDALRDASRTAGTFSTTLDQVANTMPVVSERIVGLRTDLSSLESTTPGGEHLWRDSIGLGRGCGREGLAEPRRYRHQLSLVGVALAANSEALAANATRSGRSPTAPTPSQTARARVSSRTRWPMSRRWSS